MKGHRKLLLALTLTLAAGFAGASMLTAEEAKEEASAPALVAQAAATNPNRLDYLGNTKVISLEPMRELFSHRSHVVENKIACAKCHTGVFEQKRGAARAKGDYTHADSFEPSSNTRPPANRRRISRRCSSRRSGLAASQARKGCGAAKNSANLPGGLQNPDGGRDARQKGKRSP